MLKTHNWIGILIAALLVAGCSGGRTSPTPLLISTVLPPTATLSPTPYPTLSPTDTAEPSATPIGGGSIIAYTSWFGSVSLIKGDGSDAHTVGVAGSSAFPQWSPDGKWLAYLVLDGPFEENGTESKPVRTAQLWVSAPDGSNSKQVAEFNYPQLAQGNTPVVDFLSYTHLFWSPDSTQLAYLNYVNHVETSQRTVDFEIWVASVSGGNKQRIATATLAWDDWTYRTRPLAWSPDGSQIAYTTFSSSDHGVYVVSENGGEPKRLTDSKFASYPTWTSDGKSILFVESSILSHVTASGHPMLSLTPGTLKLVSVEGGDVAKLSDEQVVEPTLSPDGSQVAYHVDGKGIVVLNLSDKTEMVVSPACAYFGNLYSIGWSQDGRLLAFESGTPIANGCSFDENYGWRVFNLKDAEIVRIPSLWGGYSFSPDSTQLVAPSGSSSGFSGELMLAYLQDGTKSSLGINQVFGPIWQP